MPLIALSKLLYMASLASAMRIEDKNRVDRSSWESVEAGVDWRDDASPLAGGITNSLTAAVLSPIAEKESTRSSADGVGLRPGASGASRSRTSVRRLRCVVESQ